MNADAIRIIWQAIADSERSDDLPFIEALNRALMPQPDRAALTAATEPLRTATVTLPLLSRP